MLIYSENRYISTETNMMIIRSRDNNGYYYVHRGLYDQAVVLSYLYKEDYKELCEVLTGNEGSREDVDLFVETLPTPLNILGCFLLLVEEPLEDLVDMVGAIHVMSNSINFSKLVGLPAEVRANVVFSLSIREEYQLPWDRFIKESIPWTEDFYLRRDSIPMNGTLTDTANASETSYEEACIGDDGVEYDDPLSALLFGAGDDIFDMPPEEDEAEETVEESAPEPAVEPAPTMNTASVMQVAAATIVESNPELIVGEDSAPPIKSGLDFLRGLGT